MASRKVIISAEEIVDTEEIRRDPGRTSIPYYSVDAVVHAPFGAYPGECTGYYASDPAGVIEVVGATMADNIDPYLEKYVYSVANHQEMLDKHVEVAKLLDMQSRLASREV